MSKGDIVDRITKIAAEVASKSALETYEIQKQKEKKKLQDSRLRNTRRLLQSYREIKIHAGDAIASLGEVVNEDYDFFKDIMEETYTVDVSAIIRTRARSAIMLSHIDAMLQSYERICYGSKKPEDQRRYRVLENLYLTEKAMSVKEIADAEGVDVSTIYKDIEVSCEKVSALLFGIQWIEL